MSTAPVPGSGTFSRIEQHRPVDHVIVIHFRNLRWEVACDGITRPMIDWLFSRERAIEHALELAQEHLAQPGGMRVKVALEDGDESWEEVLEQPAFAATGSGR